MRGHTRAAAVLTIAAVACLILPAASVTAQQPRHVDYGGLPSTDEAVRQAGQGLLDDGQAALTNVLDEGDPVTALDHANASRETGQRLALASQLAQRVNTSLPEILADLGPASEDLGHSLWNLTNATTLLLLEDPDPVAAYLAHEVVDRDLIQARQSLAVYDRHGFDTTPLREILDRLDTTVGDPLLPPGTTALADPPRVHHGQRFELLVLDGDRPGAPVTLDGPGSLDGRSTLDDQGFTRMALRAPWDADAGRHTLLVGIGQDDQRTNATVNLTLTKVPTDIVDLRLDPTGDDRVLHLRLIGPADTPVPGASLEATQRPVDSDPGTDPANSTDQTNLTDQANTTHDAAAREVNATTSLTTGPRGGTSLSLGNQTRSVDLVYPGNRTHAATATTWEDHQGRATGGQATETDRIRQLFEQVGVSTRPTAPVQDLTLLTLVAGGIIIAVALEIEHVVFLDRRWRSTPPARATGSSASGSALPEDHPLIQVLDAEGLPAASLTLREAAVALDRLGAPGVFAWARRHEQAFYRDQPLPPVPAELVVWVEARLGRPVPETIARRDQP